LILGTSVARLVSKLSVSIWTMIGHSSVIYVYAIKIKCVQSNAILFLGMKIAWIAERK